MCLTLHLKLQDDIQKAMNRNEVTLSLFSDYSKVFERVDHTTLLHKLQLCYINFVRKEAVCSDS